MYRTFSKTRRKIDFDGKNALKYAVFHINVENSISKLLSSLPMQIANGAIDRFQHDISNSSMEYSIRVGQISWKFPADFEEKFSTKNVDFVERWNYNVSCNFVFRIIYKKMIRWNCTIKHETNHCNLAVQRNQNAWWLFSLDLANSIQYRFCTPKICSKNILWKMYFSASCFQDFPHKYNSNNFFSHHFVDIKR